MTRGANDPADAVSSCAVEDVFLRHADAGVKLRIDSVNPARRSACDVHPGFTAEQPLLLDELEEPPRLITDQVELKRSRTAAACRPSDIRVCVDRRRTARLRSRIRQT
jgi:hypothetical protein